MYEIPPSVDHYLRISSRSMIHFPSVSLESTLSSTLQGDQTTHYSPKKQLLSEFESSLVSNGKYLDESPKRKRSADDYDEQQLSCQKHFKRNHEEDEESLGNDIEAWTNDLSQQRVHSATAQADNETLHLPSRVTVRKEQLNQQHSSCTRKLPELLPKASNGSYNNNVQTTWVCNSGKAATRKNPWGPQSYSELISGAIRATPNHRASLQQIYEWIVNNIPWFHDKADYPSTKGWKNAIRHTLSIRKRFARIINDRTPHASLWTFSRHGYRTMAK